MEDIMQMARVAAEVGARSAIEKYEAQQKRAKSERRDKRLRNTRLLLQNYRNFKACIEHSVFDIEQMQENVCSGATGFDVGRSWFITSR